MNDVLQTPRVLVWLAQIEYCKTRSPAALTQASATFDAPIQPRVRSTFSQLFPAPVPQRAITLNPATRRVRNGYETRS